MHLVRMVDEMEVEGCRPQRRPRKSQELWQTWHGKAGYRRGFANEQIRGILAYHNGKGRTEHDNDDTPF